MNENIRELMEPQPEWQEEPVFDNGAWCGRYQYFRQGYDGEPDVDVDVFVVEPPKKGMKPVEIDGKWYWEF
jgi:hypothetical protein